MGWETGLCHTYLNAKYKMQSGSVLLSMRACHLYQAAQMHMDSFTIGSWLNVSDTYQEHIYIAVVRELMPIHPATDYTDTLNSLFSSDDSFLIFENRDNDNIFD